MSTEFCTMCGGVEKKSVHFNSGTMCTYVVIVPSRPLYPREKAPDTIRYVEGSD